MASNDVLVGAILVVTHQGDCICGDILVGFYSSGDVLVLGLFQRQLVSGITPVVTY